MTNTTPEAVAEMVEKLTTKTGRTFRYQAAAMLTALSAEVERLNALINATAEHWLTLQYTHPIQWEGAVDGAMEAACSEIKTLAVEVEKQKALVRRVQSAAKTLETTRCEVYSHYVKASKINTEAVATLDSERDMNAILTEENDTLRAEVERLKAYQHKILTKHGIVVAECDEALRQYKEATNV